MIKKLEWKSFLLLLIGIFGGSFICICGLTLATKVVGWPAWRQDISLNSRSDQNYFSAEGKATLEAIPDQAVVNLGVQVTETTVAAAQEQVNQIISDLQTQLAALGIEKKDIQTQDYSLYPNYNWEKGQGDITGYTVNSAVQVTCTNFDLLNQIIDAATTLGVNQVNNVNFTLSTAKQAELKKEARQQAIAQAKSNAQELANLTGIKLGNITNVYEYEPEDRTSTGVMFAKNMALTDSAEAATPTSVEAGTTSYNYQVTLTYQTY